MAVLPSGFALPPWPYLLALVGGTVVVGRVLWAIAPPVTAGTVLGLAPWMAVGSALHALFVVDAAPGAVAPLFGAPAVYLTVFVGLGAFWAAATVNLGDAHAVNVLLGLTGLVVLVPAVAAVLVAGGAVDPYWPVVGLLASVVVAGTAWLLLHMYFRTAAETTAWPGGLVVLGHAVDGVSTAIGVDALGFGERTPLSRAVIDVAAALPTAEALGAGWLFVLVKLAVAGAVVVLFADLVQDDPRQGHLLLAVVAAVGLGPGVHNLLLYAVAG